MRDTKRTKAFKKAYKLLIKRGKDMRKLHRLIELLIEAPILSDGRVVLPDHYENHKLVGRFSGSWDCHIEPDWLLLYRFEQDCLILEDTGRHADIFND